MEVVWDETKAERNLEKRDNSFEEAATVLVSPTAITFSDDDHDEGRFVTIGFSQLAKSLVVVYC